MKDFFDRRQAGLDVEDLRRIARILLEDLGPVLEGHEIVVRLVDSPDWQESLTDDVKAAVHRNRPLLEKESGRLSLPVVYRQTPLALITATPTAGHALDRNGADLLPLIVRLSLEKILLYKINITDRETGLNNEDYFRSYLRRNLEPPGRLTGRSGRPRPLSLGEKETNPGLTVILGQVRDFEKLAADHGRLEASRVLGEVARWLGESGSGAVCLARVDRDRLGTVLPRDDLEAGRAAVENVLLRYRDGMAAGLPPFGLAFGLASHPGDFAEDGGQADGAESLEDDLAGLLMAKAEAALHRASSHGRERVFTYREVIERGGRVVQVMPFNRVVVNLGRNVGAREGQTFVLWDADGPGPAEYKGEVVLFEVHRDFALGEVARLRSSLSRVQPGDPLSLGRRSAEEPAAEGGEAGSSLDPLLGIPDHRGFQALLGRLVEDEDRFAVILVRMDGYDRHRTTMGHIESDRQMKSLYDLIEGMTPEGAVIGRFSTDSLAVFCPGMTEAEAGERVTKWRDHISAHRRQTASLGAAVFPCGPFSLQDVMNNAQKALEHATFLGPASVAVFDSVSLNLSGDKRFEAGDLDGAVDEYDKALQINPDDLNVLNSLGVCYGQRREVDRALDTFARVLERDPDNLMAHYNRGFALALDDRREEALACFRRASDIDPESFDALYHRGRMALDLDLVDEALESFERASRLDGRRPIVFRYLGQTLLEAQRPGEAVDAFKAAVRFDPEDAASLSQLGVLYLESGKDLDVALSLLRQSVQIDPSNSLFRQRLARALAVAGNRNRAEEEYRRAMDMGARSREVYFELAGILKDQGRIEEARDLLGRSLEVDPEFKPAAEALAALAGD